MTVEHSLCSASVRRPLTVLMALLAVLVLAPADAAAQTENPAAGPGAVPVATSPAAEARSSAAPSPWGVEGQLGLGMPLGAIAIEGRYSPLAIVSLSAGVGRSWYGNTQVGFMPRVHVVSLNKGAVHLSVGAGLSFGAYEQSDFLGLGSDQFVDDALWGNLELSFSVKAGSLNIRGFSGYSRTLSVGDNPDASSSYTFFELPYLGMGFGYSF